MKNYDEEYIGFEALPHCEIIGLLSVQEPVIEEITGVADALLDEHELAMAAWFPEYYWRFI